MFLYISDFPEIKSQVQTRAVHGKSYQLLLQYGDGLFQYYGNVVDAHPIYTSLAEIGTLSAFNEASQPGYRQATLKTYRFDISYNRPFLIVIDLTAGERLLKDLKLIQIPFVPIAIEAVDESTLYIVGSGGCDKDTGMHVIMFTSVKVEHGCLASRERSCTVNQLNRIVTKLECNKPFPSLGLLNALSGYYIVFEEDAMSATSCCYRVDIASSVPSDCLIVNLFVNRSEIVFFPADYDIVAYQYLYTTYDANMQGWQIKYQWYTINMSAYGETIAHRGASNVQCPLIGSELFKCSLYVHWDHASQAFTYLSDAMSQPIVVQTTRGTVTSFVKQVEGEVKSVIVLADFLSGGSMLLPNSEDTCLSLKYTSSIHICDDGKRIISVACQKGGRAFLKTYVLIGNAYHYLESNVTKPVATHAHIYAIHCPGEVYDYDMTGLIDLTPVLPSESATNEPIYLAGVAAAIVGLLVLLAGIIIGVVAFLRWYRRRRHGPNQAEERQQLIGSGVRYDVGENRVDLLHLQENPVAAELNNRLGSPQPAEVDPNQNSNSTRVPSVPITSYPISGELLLCCDQVLCFCSIVGNVIMCCYFLVITAEPSFSHNPQNGTQQDAR